MVIPKSERIYWYRHFKNLLSGWTKAEQIQFHQYAIDQLRKEGG